MMMMIIITIISCRICGKATECVSHLLAVCGALALSKYLSWYNDALKILFFEVIRLLDLVLSVGPWYLKAEPKATLYV